MADNLDPNVLSLMPKKFKGFKVIIERYNKEVIDITGSITEISLYETIYTPFVYGEMIIVDNSAMLSTFPFIGQERVLIVWEREDKVIYKIFRVTDVFNVRQVNESTGGYGLSITSEKQIRNSFSLFSKSYKGNSAEIIQKIYKEFLLEDLDVRIQGFLPHNIVFPYIKPMAAINMIQKATPAADKTPMFVYDTLYGEQPVLNSMKNMLEQDPVLEIDPKNTISTSSNELSSQNIDQFRNQAYDVTINRAYNTLDQMNEGAYGSQTLSVDISNRSFTATDFDFQLHAPSIGKEWISTFFTFDDVPKADNPNDVLVNGIRSTKLRLQYQNEYAYEDYPNLNTIDENLLAGMRSYMKRLKSTSVTVYMNSVTELEAGKTVDLKYYRFSPKLQNEDVDDKVNSGKYLISALRHYVKNGEYTMSLELVRDGIGEDADLYVNRNPPNFGNPPRVQKSLLADYEPQNLGSSIFGDLFDNE